MMRASRFVVVLVAVLCAAFVSACSKSEPVIPTSGKELQRVKSGDLDVVLFAPGDTVPAGKALLTLEFQRSDSHALVDVGDLKLAATMPMAGFPDMQANIVSTKGQPGRYAVEADLGMKGDWNIGVEWNGPAGAGKASFKANAQ